MDDKDESKNVYEPSLLSFEDEDKIFSSGPVPLIAKNEELKGKKNINIEQHKNNKAKIIHINHQKLTFNSRYRLFISVLLVCLSLIFIPFHSVANSYLLSIEKYRLFNSLDNTISFETLNSSSLKNLFLFFDFNANFI